MGDQFTWGKVAGVIVCCLAEIAWLAVRKRNPDKPLPKISFKHPGA